MYKLVAASFYWPNMFDNMSSSESMPVVGVGGAGLTERATAGAGTAVEADGEADAAEAATTRLLAALSVSGGEIFASAALRFLVVGGILAVYG